jgi:hypothetical protein
MKLTTPIPFLISMRTGALHMTGTAAFLVFFSLVWRVSAIPLAIAGWAAFVVFCALLLLTCLEGAILWQTEIDTGTSAAATLSAPGTLPPDHRPPRRRAQSQRLRRLSVWTPLPRPPRPRWSASLIPPRRLLQPSPARHQLPSQFLRRASSLLPPRSSHSVIFPIPARGVSIASG